VRAARRATRSLAASDAIELLDDLGRAVAAHPALARYRFLVDELRRRRIAGVRGLCRALQPHVGDDAVVERLARLRRETDVAAGLSVSPWVRAFYDDVHRRFGSAPWMTFMNHGLVSWRDAALPPLHREDERWRHQVALYLHLVDVGRTRGMPDLDRSVLVDVGCGRGGGLAALARYAGLRTGVGVDQSRDHVAFCRAHAPDGIRFKTGSALDLPFRARSVDVVVSVESSHGYADMAAFLGEVCRVLRAGGVLLFADVRPAGALAAVLDLELRRSELAMLARDDITARVAKACALDARRFATLAGATAAQRRWLTALATAKAREYRARRSVYVTYVLRKDHVAGGEETIAGGS
jgi:SAM-dependent methyltransferase